MNFQSTNRHEADLDESDWDEEPSVDTSVEDNLASSSNSSVFKEDLEEKKGEQLDGQLENGLKVEDSKSDDDNDDDDDQKGGQRKEENTLPPFMNFFSNSDSNWPSHHNFYSEPPPTTPQAQQQQQHSQHPQQQQSYYSPLTQSQQQVFFRKPLPPPPLNWSFYNSTTTSLNHGPTYHESPLQYPSAYRRSAITVQPYPMAPISSHAPSFRESSEAYLIMAKPALTTSNKCKICGRSASGNHYGALTCEGCKSFFRRVVINRNKYVCKKMLNCEIKEENRRKSCRACRYQLCLKAGMKPELCLKNFNAKVRSRTETSGEAENSRQRLMVQIKDGYKEHIANWVQSYFNSLLAFKNLVPIMNTLDSIRGKYRAAFSLQLTTLISNISLFRQLAVMDQNSIVKNCTHDLMLIHVCRFYKRSEKKFLWPSGHNIGNEELKSSRLSYMADKLLELAESLAQLNLEDDEMAFLVALRLASANGLKGHFKGIYDEVYTSVWEYAQATNPDPKEFVEKLSKMMEEAQSCANQLNKVIWSSNEALKDLQCI